MPRLWRGDRARLRVPAAYLHLALRPALPAAAGAAFAGRAVALLAPSGRPCGRRLLPPRALPVSVRFIGMRAGFCAAPMRGRPARPSLGGGSPPRLRPAGRRARAWPVRSLPGLFGRAFAFASGPRLRLRGSPQPARPALWAGFPRSSLPPGASPSALRAVGSWGLFAPGGKLSFVVEKIHLVVEWFNLIARWGKRISLNLGDSPRMFLRQKKCTKKTGESRLS